LPNSRVVIKVDLDEIPLTSRFNSQKPQVEDVELSNTRIIVVIGLDEIPLTS
jgi:hypothetical protein